MSQKAFPWLKLYKEAHRHPKIREMPLDQQAVFYNLLQWAGQQKEEGAFTDDDREALAFEVARDDLETLDAAIKHLLRRRTLIRLEDGRLAFSDWAEHQVSAREKNADRQRRHYWASKPSEETDSPAPPDLTGPNADVRFSTETDQPNALDVRLETPEVRGKTTDSRDTTYPPPTPSHDSRQLVDPPGVYEVAPTDEHPIYGFQSEDVADLQELWSKMTARFRERGDPEHWRKMRPLAIGGETVVIEVDNPGWYRSQWEQKIKSAARANGCYSVKSVEFQAPAEAAG